jgi:hypothetical protein
MSSHPGCELADAVALSECLKRDHYAPEQVQDFYPTPGTASTVMYYTGIDPLSMKKVFVATDPEQKRLQRALLQCNRPENAALVRKALRMAGREDLIGFAPTCLVRPEGAGRPQHAPNTPKQGAEKRGNTKNTPKRGEKTAKNAREGKATGTPTRATHGKPVGKGGKPAAKNQPRSRKK